MPDYREHPAKPVRLQGDDMVVLDAGDETVWFYLDADGWEGLHARRLAPDLARIAAVPVFAYGVGLGDEVQVRESDEGAAVATAVVRSAGNVTFRVIFPAQAGAEAADHWRSLLTGLAPYGCWLDVWSPQLVAVSAGADVAAEVAHYLTAREEGGELVFEAVSASAASSPSRTL